MIKFQGFISGNAKKHCIFKQKLFGFFCILSAVIALLPTVIAFTKSSVVIIGYLSASAVSLLACFLPQGKKRAQSLVPNKIFVEDGYIVSVGEKFQDAKQVNLAKKLIDYGDFYEVIFPIGNASQHFVCQKNLLVSGTLEDFEALFEGKIVRK